MNIEPNKKVEEILSSLDGAQRAAIPDFFYTRLKAKMENGYAADAPKLWVLRPVYAIAALVVILLINGAVLFTNTNNTKGNSIVETDNLQSIAAEYRLNDSNTPYDLNVEK